MKESELPILELEVLDAARAIAAEGYSPNNNRLFARLFARLAPGHPTYQMTKRARARLAELGLLPTPAGREAVSS